MKAVITIKFVKISGQNVGGIENKKLLKATKKTVKKLCEQVERYFKDFNIETSTDYEIK